ILNQGRLPRSLRSTRIDNQRNGSAARQPQSRNAIFAERPAQQNPLSVDRGLDVIRPLGAQRVPQRLAKHVSVTHAGDSARPNLLPLFKNLAVVQRARWQRPPMEHQHILQSLDLDFLLIVAIPAPSEDVLPEEPVNSR